MNISRSSASRIALGSVQFGFPYGISNTKGKVKKDDVSAILARAATAGMDTIDTAFSYGVAEQCLGDIGVNAWKVVTKLPSLPMGGGDISDWAIKTFSESLARLKRSSIYCLMLHQPSDILGSKGDDLVKVLDQLKADGVIEKIGISVYTTDEIKSVSSRYAVDLVQAPFNILDRRLLDSGWLDRLERQNVEVHVRSVFLQGLLLMPQSERPVKFRRWNDLWRTWDAWLLEHKLTPLEACMRFVLKHQSIRRVIVGVESLVQIEEILNASFGELPEIPTAFTSGDPELLNPSKWMTI